MVNVLLVGVGGFLGAALRYLVSGWITESTGSSFPYGTLTVNLVGCLAIGLVGGVSDARELLTPSARLFLVVGILGGFTTYSTFAYDALQLARIGEAARLAGYLTLHVLLGIVAAAGAFRFGRLL